MTNYRLFPSTNGPASAVAFAGSFLSGVVFTVKAGGTWFTGYWWWVAGSGQSTAPVKCALWAVGTASGGYLVPGSVVTSGILAAGQWNYIPLASPVQLAQGYNSPNTVNGSAYIAAVGVNGSFPDTNGFWGTAGPGAGGITSGPLVAYSAPSVSGGTLPPPWTLPQGVFTTGSSDPAAVMPNQASGTDNFWVDVQVSDAAPAGYAGSYRLWPNKADGNPVTTGDALVAYNVATEVDLSQACTLDAVHYLVPPNASAAAGLATKADVWRISDQVLVATIGSPAWTAEDGGATPGLGANNAFWAKAAFPAGVILAAGNYRVSVYNANGTLGSWNPKDATTGYFSGGAAAAGITWGPVSAPNQASAQLADFYPGAGTGTTGGQPVFAFDGLNDFPHFTTGLNPAQVYWVDLEVTPVPGGGGGNPGRHHREGYW